MEAFIFLLVSVTIIILVQSEDLPYRDDYKCGGEWLAPNGNVAQCDPGGIYPCCSSTNWCGNTADHCDCEECIDYTRVTDPALSYREDNRCGGKWLAPNGKVAKCDPDGIYSCCSPYKWCGNTADHCDCEGCIAYTRVADTDLPYRDDYRCGGKWLAPNGKVAQCDPDGIYPCCSATSWCGITADHCDCAYCIDYTRVTVPALPYRDDHQCGGTWLAPNGKVAQCDPDDIYPCCSPDNQCGNTADQCDCDECIDYTRVPGTGPPIVFKRVTSYDWIYDDSGTGAISDVSIWRPKDNEYSYFAVGDVAVSSHSKPSSSATMVKQITSGALSAPVSFTEVWHNRGSGGKYDVRIMRMNPPSGFTCLGHVVVLGYNSNPDAKKYRCVKTSYTTTGKYDLIWLDRDLDVGLWGNNVANSDVFAIDSNTFTSFATHATPGGSPPMMDGRQVINHQMSTSSTPHYVFTLFEVTDLDQIWNDEGSKAPNDISIWRSRGRADTYSLGDIAVSGGRPTKGYVVKAHELNALRAAYEFVQVWNDRGSQASWNGAIYRPSCPPGYRGIGHVAVGNHYDKPSSNDFRCVNADYTVTGKWKWVWDNRGSLANADVSVFKALSSGYGQGVEAMSTIARYSAMNDLPFVLNPSIVNYVVGKPAVQYIIQSITYLFDDRKIGQKDPENIARTIVVNKGTTQQQVTRELTYTYDESYSWGHSAGIEIGISTTIQAGVPFIFETEVTVSASAAYEHQWGGSTTESRSDTISVQTTVQPRSSKSVIVVGSRYTLDIPYEATLITVYEDGTRGTRGDFKGVYRGVQVNEIRVTYDADIPLVD